MTRRIIEEAIDLLTVERDALEEGITTRDGVSDDPEDRHTRDAIAGMDDWIARAKAALEGGHNAGRHRQPGCGDRNCHLNREEKMEWVGDDAFCDPCIAPIVRALNAMGVPTLASCCGHGFRPGSIVLNGGRELIVARSWNEARKIEAMFPTDINGDGYTPAPPVDGD